MHRLPLRLQRRADRRLRIPGDRRLRLRPPRACPDRPPRIVSGENSRNSHIGTASPSGPVDLAACSACRTGDRRHSVASSESIRIGRRSTKLVLRRARLLRSTHVEVLLPLFQKADPVPASLVAAAKRAGLDTRDVLFDGSEEVGSRMFGVAGSGCLAVPAAVGPEECGTRDR